MTYQEIEIETLINNLLNQARVSTQNREDLFQELYLYYLTIKDKYKIEYNVPFQAYIITFLQWRLKTAIKKITMAEKTHINLELHSTPNSYDSTENDDYENIIRKLSSEDLDLLKSRYGEEKTLAEIAAATGLSVAGIKKKITKAERRLKWLNEKDEKKS